MNWGDCGKNCPVDVNPWSTYDTLKVTHHIVDQKETLIAVKLCAIMSLSLHLIALMVKFLGISPSGSEIFRRNNHYFCPAMMISNTLKGLEDETTKYFSLITKLLTILSILLIIFTILYFTCLGCFLVLNDSTSRAAQTVTLSSEGPVNETYPLSMGEYQLVSSWYRHKDRQDRFLMYNNLGNIEC